MLDNFGLGEFFFLAMLALLFFGPERLPQIGARLGRWVANLTQYSKAFMTEWREEALVIHEAVEEVRGIRDEIAAARAEISSTLETAREDMTDGIDAAKDAISGAQIDVTQRIRLQREEAAADLERAAREESGEALPGSSGENFAIAKTQQILTDLQAKRDAIAPVRGDESPAEDKEWQEIQNVIEAGLEPKEATEPEEAPAGDGIPAEAAIEEAEQSEGSGAASTATAQDAEEKVEEEAPAEDSAFDRTQQILDDLMKRRSGAKAEEPVTATTQDTPPSAPQPTGTAVAPVIRSAAETLVVQGVPPEPKETAFDRTQQILDDLKKRRTAKAEPVAEGSEGTDPVAEVSTSAPSEFEQLSVQVLRLEDEMKALRQELQLLRTWAPPETATATQEQTHTASDEQPVGEAA